MLQNDGNVFIEPGIVAQIKKGEIEMIGTRGEDACEEVTSKL